MSVEGVVTKTVADVVSNDKTIEKASSCFSKLFPYLGLKKVAVDYYVDEIKQSNLPLGMKTHLIINAKQNIKKMNNQYAIASIAVDSLENITVNMDNQEVDEEWIDRFMDSAGHVSKEEMQLIWGKMLAEEFKNPGSTPTAMTRVLSEITPRLAKVFRLICSMKVVVVPIRDDGEIDNTSISYSLLVPFAKQDYKFLELDITFRDFSELDTLGVIRFNSISSYVRKDIKKALVYDTKQLLMVDEIPREGLLLGNVMLTSVGEALSHITEHINLDDYDQMIQQYYIDNHCNVNCEHEYEAVVDGTTLEVVKKTNSSCANQ